MNVVRASLHALMATYAIGDVQGCFASLRQLTKTVGFNPAEDRLWFVGDLVNRGPDSLGVLRYIRDLGPAAVTVLGNHDLFLLAVATGLTTFRRDDTLTQILDAQDCDELTAWLRQQPLLYPMYWSMRGSCRTGRSRRPSNSPWRQKRHCGGNSSTQRSAPSTPATIYNGRPI